ncbi:hypothetical protein LLS47_11245 [Rouxiella badensis]|uniref:hypothetical protein n=1 Tax=Rouxiella badensis TaxID=1646377 RepID=UPI001D1488D0|nr:hypothetical protein [Rouxiella badensis]MCC3733503.1 hypothetical protein [Rouxiella badensis]MCC3757846.1 hypothetical protein [Rouxiella badensis]
MTTEITATQRRVALKKPHRSRARTISVQQAARFNAVFSLCDTSPSGLVWKEWNRGIGARSREAGETAGCQKNNCPGVYFIGLDGKRWYSRVVISAIQALQEGQNGNL